MSLSSLVVGGLVLVKCSLDIFRRVNPKESSAENKWPHSAPAAQRLTPTNGAPSSLVMRPVLQSLVCKTVYVAASMAIERAMV